MRAFLHEYVHPPAHSPHVWGDANTGPPGVCAFARNRGTVPRCMIHFPHKLARVNVRVNVGHLENYYDLPLLKHTNIPPNIHPAPFVWKSN